MKGLFTTSVIFALSLATAGAFAEEPPAPPPGPPRAEAPVLARLGAMLDASAAEGRANRHALLAGMLLAAAATVPVGAALWSRSDSSSRSIGPGFVIGGAAPLAFSWVLLLPTSVEKLDDEFRRRRLANEDPGTLVASIEKSWAAAAQKAHDRRILGAVVLSVLGVSVIGAGSGILYSRGGLGALNLRNKNTLGAILVGTGVPVLANGVRMAFVATPEESGWAAYRALGGGGRGATAMQFNVVPTVGGATANLSLVF